VLCAVDIPFWTDSTLLDLVVSLFMCSPCEQIRFYPFARQTTLAFEAQGARATDYPFRCVSVSANIARSARSAASSQLYRQRANANGRLNVELLVRTRTRIMRQGDGSTLAKD